MPDITTDSYKENSETSIGLLSCLPICSDPWSKILKGYMVVVVHEASGYTAVWCNLKCTDRGVYACCFWRVPEGYLCLYGGELSREYSRVYILKSAFNSLLKMYFALGKPEYRDPCVY